MTDLWRLLDLGVMDPYEAEAMGEVLLTARRRKLIPNTLFIRVPERFVEISQWVSLKRVNVEYCRSEGIPIVRERGGTSVVVYDGKSPICDLVSDPILQDSLSNHNLYRKCMVKSLQFMGVEAYLKENSNDILVAGKKILGSGGGIFRGVFIASSGILVDFNYDLCEKAIVEFKNHRERLTNLKALLGREVSYGEVVSALKRGFEAILQVEFEVSNVLTEAEERILEDLLVKYRSDEWLKYGKWSPVKDYSRRGDLPDGDT